MTHDLKNEIEMKADALAESYGWWGEHPKYTADDWQDEVYHGNTRSGYWVWVANFIDSDGE